MDVDEDDGCDQVPKIISNLSRGDLGGLRGPWADGGYR